MKNSQLYKNIISDYNIYNSIYSLESYVFEKGLLSNSDLKLYNELQDKHNFEIINSTIKKCREKLEKILNSQELFEVQVYFKLKKYNKESDRVEFRPLHTADLHTQICMVCLLNQLMFDDVYGSNNQYDRKLSDLSKLLPSNFYGNIPSTRVDSLFINWKTKYKEYTESIVNTYYRHKENKTKEFEINLDLEKFFPSINPIVIFNFIINKIHVEKDDLLCLKVLITKLLYFKLKNIDDKCSNEYYNSSLGKHPLLSKGLPQGLPQAYYFGNLCMLIVSKCIPQVFPESEAFYYVDDSVIYCNTKKSEFKNNLKVLNLKIEQEIKEYCNTTDIPIKKETIEFHDKLNYNIRLNEDKSSISDINSAKQGLTSLQQLGVFSSQIPFAITTSLDEVEDSNLKNKLDVLVELIDKELARIEAEKNTDDEYYTKMLIRYKKFFLFRQKLLGIKDEDLEKVKEDFYNNYLSDYGNITVLVSSQKTAFFEKYDEEIFHSEMRLILQHLPLTERKGFLEKINIIEKLLSSGINEKYLYFIKDIAGSLEIQLFENKKYTCLAKKVKEIKNTYYKASKELIIKNLRGVIGNYCFENLEYPEYTRFVFSKSEEFNREIVNANFSHIINVQINDDYTLLRTDNRPLNYYELRLLLYLRNKNFSIKEFAHFASKILIEFDNDNLNEKIDYQILEVVKIFNQVVREPLQVDSLILVHKIVDNLWKNGSKFLHFYTLHNEEHSIELIKNCLRIAKTVDFFKLKTVDFYILFLSCYLHDISMVLHPDMDMFISDTSPSNEIYTRWRSDIEELNKKSKVPPSEFKRNMMKYFKEIFQYFENKTRSNHHKLSSKFIKDKSDYLLNFIEKNLLQVVADVSEAHCFDTHEVYGRRSFARNNLFSLKYLMIILRLSDLFDISKDRISYNILKESIKHMDNNGKFHWISHLITDKFEFRVKYYIYEKEKDNDQSYLSDGVINEEVILDIFVNSRQLTHFQNTDRCKMRRSILNEKENRISISIDNEECKEQCNFLCKWMCKKHEYLFSELYELQKYLNRVQNGLFTTQFIVNFNYSNHYTLDPEFMDVISQTIEN